MVSPLAVSSTFDLLVVVSSLSHLVVVSSHSHLVVSTSHAHLVAVSPAPLFLGAAHTKSSGTNGSSLPEQRLGSVGFCIFTASPSLLGYSNLLAYGLLFPVLYRSLCGISVWLPFSPSPLVLAQISSLKTPPMEVTKDGDGGDSPCVLAYELLSLHGKLISLIYSAMVEWPRQLSVCVELNLRFMTFAGDIPLCFVSFGSTYATSSCIYFALARYSAVCSPLTGPIPVVGVVFVLSFWWHVKERFIVIFSPMCTDVASHDYPLIPRSNQSSVPLFPPIWSELDVHASLVLQGSSFLRMLSAYGAVCVVLWVTLDAIFEEAYDVVVIQSHLVFSYDLYRHSIFYVIVVVVIVYLAVNSLFLSSSNGV